jgi:hypothetical protein
MITGSLIQVAIEPGDLRAGCGDISQIPAEMTAADAALRRNRGAVTLTQRAGEVGEDRQKRCGRVRPQGHPDCRHLAGLSDALMIDAARIGALHVQAAIIGGEVKFGDLQPR